MDRREPPAFDLNKAEEALPDEDLAAATGGANMAAGLGGPDTRKGAGRSIGSMESITVGSAPSPGLG